MVLFRKLITPDGTELVSRSVHDFVTHDDKNGKWYMLDGGVSSGYYRSSANGDEKIVEITTKDPFETIREYFERWNYYGKEYVKLKNISCNWLQNIIDYFIEKGLQNNPIFLIFVEEKLYRAENEIYIPEISNYEIDFK